MIKKLPAFIYAAIAFTMLFIASALASQSDPNEGANLSGLTFRQNLNNATAAMLTSHSGTSRPGYAVAGTVWLDTTGTPWKMKLFDGTSDITIGEFDATNHTFQDYKGTALSRLQLYATDTGAANAYAIAPTPPLAAYATGQIVTLKPAHNNTGASTINESTLGTKNIKLLDGTDPTANAMVTTGVYFLFYDGTNFVLLNPSVGASICAVANGCTGQSTAAAARGSSGLNIDGITTHGDSIYTILATDRTVATSASLTASRAWTLPAANAVNAGQYTCVVDQAGSVTGTNTIVITRAGSDTIDGGTTYTLNAAYQGICLVSDGSSKWSSRLLPGAALPAFSGGDITSSAGSVNLSIAANAVTTAKINNSAVTLAKIANASASSKLLGSGASGSGSAYSELSLGTGLSFTGNTLNVTSASQEWVLLDTQTASASASLNMTTGWSSSYSEIVVIGVDLRPATNSVSGYLRTSGDGSTFDSAAGNYAYTQTVLSPTAGSPAVSGSTSDTKIQITTGSTAVTNGTNDGMSFEAHFINVSSTTRPKYIRVSEIHNTSTTSIYMADTTAARLSNTAAILGCQFLFSSGNITSGTIYVYGLKNT